MSIQERKEQLIAQGAAFRALVIDAKHDVDEGLRPVLFAKDTIGHIAGAAMAAFRNGTAAAHFPAPGINLPALLPLLMTGIAALPKGFVKKAIMLAAVTGAVGAAVVMVRKRKQIGLTRRH